MSTKNKVIGLLSACALVGGFALGGCASAPAEAPQAAATSEEGLVQFHAKDIVDTKFVEEYAVLPKRDDVTIVDSRPTRKYDEGHIPTAVSVPDLSFDKLAAGALPADKNQLVIFYCGGLKCSLSHKSAYKAEALGYTNVKVYAEGEPAWRQSGHIIAVSKAYMDKIASGEIKAVVVDARPTGGMHYVHVGFVQRE